MTIRQARLLHLSDVHCGRPFVAEHVEAAFEVAKSAHFDAIIVSGDMSQRARIAEFRDARIILDRLCVLAPTIVVPGNHDAQWWLAPFGVGNRHRVLERYRRYIQEDTEPTLNIPGVTMVGVNSAPGIMPWTLTWNPRDIRVKGGLTDEQLEGAAHRFAAAQPGDLRVLVVHHNVVRGRISNRWGLARPHRVLDAIARMKAHVVCTGHDHEERIEIVERSGKRFMVSTANTLSSRMRGKRASALNVIEAEGATLTVTPWLFNTAAGIFEPKEPTSMPIER